MPQHRFCLETHHLGPDNEHPDWRIVDEQRIDAWKQLSQIYSKTSVHVGDQDYNLSIDFSEAIARLENQYEVSRRIYDEQDHSAFEDFQVGSIRIPVSVDSSDAHRYRSESIAEFIFYEIFLVMNLAAPGSFTVNLATLLPTPRDINMHGREVATEMNLYGKIFEDAFEDSAHHPWLNLAILPVHDVLQWVQSVAPRCQMVPTNPAAKCLFALLYLTRTDFGPASSAWVFNALEGLLSCKPGENFTKIIERVSILLELQSSETASMKKKLRLAYDIRSAFVHGGMKIVHPMRNEGLDPTVDDVYWPSAFTFEFGSYVALACLQSLIRRRWKYPIYEENLNGEPM
jgi:hypothetical protein